MHWSRNSSAATGENHREALDPLKHMEDHCGEDTRSAALEDSTLEQMEMP